jgi:hypothetical protein
MDLQIAWSIPWIEIAKTWSLVLLALAGGAGFLSLVDGIARLGTRRAAR